MEIYTIAETRTYEIEAISAEAALKAYKGMNDAELAPYYVEITDSEVV